MATCSPNDLLYAGRCFAGLPKPQLDAMMLALLCKLVQQNNPMATCDPTILMQEANCFMCLKPNQMQAVMLQLLCEILQGGGSGGTCIVCIAADGAPVDPATCPCSIAYNSIGQFWFWDSLTASWFPISV
jgi:hypothetical protein